MVDLKSAPAEATAVTASLPPLLLRADAGGGFGSGHVMRLAALGEAWTQRGGACVLASASLPDALGQRMAAAPGFSLAPIAGAPWSAEDAHSLIALAMANGARVAVIDSYLAPPAYLAALKAAGLRVAVIDDIGALDRYPCALIVNPNLHAEEALYAGKSDAARLLGTQYVILRGEFAAERETPRVIALQARRLLATFGGVDPHGASEIALDALARLPDIHAELIVGGANPRRDALIARAAGLSNVTLVHDARDMARRMSSAEMILSAGGTTVWEAAALGAPMMLLAANAEEEISATRLSQHGGAIFLGRIGAASPEALADAIARFAGDLGARARASAALRELVDGGGASRVAAALANLSA